MPLGEKEGWEQNYSRLCGVETDFSDDVTTLLSFNIDNGGFDFVLAPLMNPSYRPGFVDSHVLPLGGSDLVISPLQWKDQVVGKISSWIDLDSEYESMRMDSETTLKKEIDYAKHISLRACLLPTPKGTSFANYARCVNQILKRKNKMELWLRIPLRKSHGTLMAYNSEDSKDSWELWNAFRLLCDHDSNLYVALDVGFNRHNSMLLPSRNSLGRWFGESVKAAIINTECFVQTADGYLLESYGEELITRFFHHSVRVIISGRLLIFERKGLFDLQKESVNITEGTQTHPYKPYLDYVSKLFCSMEPLSEQERIELCHRDFLCTQSQPLKDNLVADSYEMLEGDSYKYIQYQRAIAKALKHRVPNEKASELTTVLMVVGAGRGSLVRASLEAAEQTGRKLKVYAVEKNLNAVVTLHNLVKARGWEGTVTVISCDVRFWKAPERADILVTELLGSFGDNKLCPECLDGAQMFLKANGISIPFSYTSFIQPITASKLYNDVKSYNSHSYFETVYSVKLHNVARLAPSQPVFTFTHPNFSKKHNQGYKKLRFDLPRDTGSALLHGFAGYFETLLYDDVHISTQPTTTTTPNMLCWVPIFFPLVKPIEVHSNTPIEAHFWRCSDSTKVWYEWSVALPTVSPIHNTNGSSYWIDL